MSRRDTDTVLNAEEREIARRLAELPAGEPPPELLERLKADVPDDLADRLAAAAGAPPSPRRRWLAAAAAVVTLVGGGWLAWSVWQVVPPAQEVVQERPAAAMEDAAPPSPETAPTRAAEEPAAVPEAVAGSTAAAPADEDAAGSADDRDAAEPGATRPPAARSVPPAAEMRSEAIRQAAPDPEAEAETGRLRVRATDPAGDPLPGTLVEVSGEGLNLLRVSDSRGDALFLSLPEGRYRVKGDLAGFNEAEVEEVEVAGSLAWTQELQLELAPSFTEEIVVTGVEAEIDTTTVHGAASYDAGAPSPPPAAKGRVPRFQDEAARRAAELPKPEPEAEPMMIPEELEREGPVAARRLAEAVLAPVEDEPLPEPPPVSPVVETAEDRLSTFGLDVDTGSYTALRAALRDGRLPPPAQVRVEEMVNAYRYADPYAGVPPEPGETFRVVAEGAPHPFAPSPRHRLLRFQVTARPVVPVERKPAVLTLVVDVSGSMDQDGRLLQVKSGLWSLLGALEPTDSVALVTFSDDARVVAPHDAAGGGPAALAAAVDSLATEGGTNAEAGLALGYETAAAAFREGAVNRVIFLSDGLANAGTTEVDALLARVAGYAERGIELTTVGVGMEFNDRLLEQLADRGDGRYLYVDGPEEAERAFVEELTGTLQTVAEEARAQVELDPRTVVRWRLLGYENRAIEDERFRWDHAVDAGEIGAGQTVTVLYEVELADPLPAPGRPLALLKLRWRDPGEERFREEETLLRVADLAESWSAAPPDLRLAATVAELGEVLRRSPHAAEPAEVLREARRLAGERPGDEQVAELLELAERAAGLLRQEESQAEAEEPAEAGGP